jgi:hypothetical protein
MREKKRNNQRDGRQTDDFIRPYSNFDVGDHVHSVPSLSGLGCNLEVIRADELHLAEQKRWFDLIVNTLGPQPLINLTTRRTQHSSSSDPSTNAKSIR